MSLFSARLGVWLGVSSIVVLVVGLALIPWGAMLLIYSRRDEVRKPEATLAMVGDELWVVGSVILVAGFPDALTSGGKVLTLAVAAVIALFAALEFVGIRRLFAK